MKEFNVTDIDGLERGFAEQRRRFTPAVPTSDELLVEIEDVGKSALVSAIVTSAGYGMRRLGHDMEQGPLVSKVIGRGLRYAGNTAMTVGVPMAGISAWALVDLGREYWIARSAEKSGKIRR